MINPADYNDFFLFLGGFLVIVGVIYLLFRHSLQNIFIAEQEAERLISEEEVSKIKAESKIHVQKNPGQETIPYLYRSRIRCGMTVKVVLLVIIIGGFLLNQFLMWKMNPSGILSKLINVNINITRK